ncbi:MarR family transcriptional regulator [Streptomyces niveus]|uniref:MarR family transcriptional regulator n=1 Tax=Streptomyces niveus TaxID=193462 RepID=UPI00343012F5
MSNIYIDQALSTRADITPLERLVLVFLGRNAGPDGIASMAVGRIAQSANTGSETVTRALRRLTNLGLLERQDRGGSLAPLHRLTIENAAGEGTEESSA